MTPEYKMLQAPRVRPPDPASLLLRIAIIFVAAALVAILGLILSGTKAGISEIISSAISIALLNGVVFLKVTTLTPLSWLLILLAVHISVIGIGMLVAMLEPVIHGTWREERSHFSITHSLKRLLKTGISFLIMQMTFELISFLISLPFINGATAGATLKTFLASCFVTSGCGLPVPGVEIKSIPSLAVGALLAPFGIYFWSAVFGKSGRLFNKVARGMAKVALLSLLISVAFIMVIDWNWALRGMSFAGKLSSTVTTVAAARNGGLPGMDWSVLSSASLFIILLLAIVGGLEGSLTGGIKFTVVSILFASTLASMRDRGTVQVSGWRVSRRQVMLAMTIFGLFVAALGIGLLLISGLVENMSPVDAIILAVSSISLSAAPNAMEVQNLSTVGQWLIIGMSLFGRFGIPAAAVLFSRRRRGRSLVKLPEEQVVVG